MKDFFKRLNWPNILLAIFLVLVGIGIYFVFHKSSDEPTAKQTAGTQVDKQQPNSTAKQPAKNPEPPKVTVPSTPPTSNTTPAPAKQLANSGPGDTAALFVGVTIAGIAVHQYLLRRRALYI